MPILIGIDTIGIQDYVFTSNRLRDVLAASWLVEQATSSMTLAQWGVSDQQVLAHAGGNAIVEVETEDSAREWTRYYTRWLHDTAPGLQCAIAHRSFTRGRLAWALQALSIDLARIKLERLPTVPHQGLSVTACCAVTGLPAIDIDHGEMVSPQIKRVRERFEEARQRWDRLVPEIPGTLGRRAAFPSELDLLGRTQGDTSLLGVVHLDGNSVGDLIRGWAGACMDAGTDDNVVRSQYHSWSSALGQLGETAMRAVVNRVVECISTATSEQRSVCILSGSPFELGFELRESREDPSRGSVGDTVFLPVRPILLAGDDITFVCDGRIALDLAAAALRAYETQPIPYLGEAGRETTLSACAGVAMVRSHAPFHRSYELAEALCRSAKRRRYEVQKMRGLLTGAWMDWHLGTTRPGETIQSIRERQFSRGMTMRPYPVEAYPGRTTSWTWMDNEGLGPTEQPTMALRGLRQTASALVPNAWFTSRTRVKRLGLLLEDRVALQRQLMDWASKGGACELPGGLPSDGFIGVETPLRDALELLDVHLRLERDPRAGSMNQSGGSR